MSEKRQARASVMDSESLKAELKDEINFDIDTRKSRIPESVVDQIIDILAARGLLILADSSVAEREAIHQRNLLHEASGKLLVAMGIANGDVPMDGPTCLMLLGEAAEHAAAPPPPANIGADSPSAREKALREAAAICDKWAAFADPSLDVPSDTEANRMLWYGRHQYAVQCREDILALLATPPEPSK